MLKAIEVIAKTLWFTVRYCPAHFGRVILAALNLYMLVMLTVMTVTHTGFEAICAGSSTVFVLTLIVFCVWSAVKGNLWHKMIAKFVMVLSFLVMVLIVKESI